MDISECQYYKIPVAVDHKRDKVYEGFPWCNLSDNPCIVAEGQTEDCETWNEIKEEVNG